MYFGIIALIIAIGALGLGTYQTILPSEGPKIYTVSNDDYFNLDFSIYRYIPQLNITYNTKTGDRVLLEYSRQLRLDIVGVTTNIEIYFDIDGAAITITSHIYLHGENIEDYQDIYSSGIMTLLSIESKALHYFIKRDLLEE